MSGTQYATCSVGARIGARTAAAVAARAARFPRGFAHIRKFLAYWLWGILFRPPPHSS